MIVPFGRLVWNRAQRKGGKVATFTFLGFTHFCKATTRGWFAMGHKTSKERKRGKLKMVNETLKKTRHLGTLNEWFEWLRKVLIGHYNYFGINRNLRSLHQYYNGVLKAVFKWINQKIQKKSMTWEKFQTYLGYNPLPKPRIVHRILW